MWTYDNKMIQIFDVKSVTIITIPFISRYIVSTISTTLYSKAIYADILYFVKKKHLRLKESISRYGSYSNVVLNWM